MTEKIEEADLQCSPPASRQYRERATIGSWVHGRVGIACVLGLSLFFAATPIGRADKVDDVISDEMHKHQITGLSLAIVEKGDIAKARGYGFTDQGGKVPVEISTLFQAGSVSKPVAALGALYLVEQGKLSLDEDANARLRTWKVPENELTKDEKVTLRRLLSHSAGLTVHGFPGYEVGKPLPSLVQILDGAKPANTAAIRVDVVPGSRWRYSGGGYTVMQQMLIDVTGKPFPQFMREAVLQPLGMEASTYEQPLPENFIPRTATGYYANGKEVKGRWHIYPEMAAAGLWTTASDLARLAIGIQKVISGQANSVISQSMVRQMLTSQKGDFGLGWGVEGNGKALRFSHGGRDEGFDAFVTAYAEAGPGAVILINANDDSGAVKRVVEVIAQEYHWPNH
jgi:CubicO group peptidase (beta-lactamase class C family)